MPFDPSNTITINSIPDDKRTERGPVLRLQIHISKESLRTLIEDGWDGETPLKGSAWVRQGEGKNGPYKFWSGPIEVDTYAQERASAPISQPRKPGVRQAPPPDTSPGSFFDDDVPF